MIPADIERGFAPVEWQQNVGPVLVFRTDGVDMTPSDLYDEADLVCKVLDRFGDGDATFDAEEYLINTRGTSAKRAHAMYE